MPKLQTLSTAALPAGLRVSRWNAFCSDTLADFAVDPADRATFTAVISRRMIRDVGLAWLSSDPAICYGGVGGVGAWAAPDGDAFLLTAPESGWIWGDHIGRTTQQSAGDMVLLDSARPWRTVARSPTSMTVVKIPATRLIGLVGDPEAVCGMQLGADQPKVALASALIRSVRAAVAADPEGDWGEETERVLLEAARLALADALAGAAGDDREGTILRRRVQGFIERNIERPDLSVALISETLGVGARRLQRAFQEVGRTPRDYIIDRRLVIAAERLRGAGSDDGGSITAIAAGVGFSDPSYFARAFKTKLGATPRAYRRIWRRPT